MAFDGFVISNLTYELSELLTEGGIQKIAQPEKDELLLTIKNNRTNYRLLISAGASLPLIYLTENNKPSPATAPGFCMLLRKHLNGARIVSIKQLGMERVIEIELENLNELGDLSSKYLMIECMGKHSNIIFLNHEKEIIDSIKHISSMVSSVREVLPGKPYFIPNTMDKKDPLSLTKKMFIEEVLGRPLSTSKSIYSTLIGFSPLMATELAYRCHIDGDLPTATLSSEQKESLADAFMSIMLDVKEHRFTPCIVFDGTIPKEFSSFVLKIYEQLEQRTYSSISNVLEQYYAEKNIISRIRVKSADLRKHVTTLLERNRKKLDLQQKQMKDTEKRNKYKVFGELINTYGYQLGEEDTKLTCINYYDNEEVTIPVDPTLTSSENANRYFNRYNKSKRTFLALTIQLAEVREEISHLESILNALEIARKEEDLVFIKEELIQSGYMKRKTGKGKRESKVRSHGKKTPKSKPLHFISSDGYDIYVGKNNFQNDELTFKFANGGDWWFHAKEMAGSHVIVKSKNNEEEPPIRTFEEAGALAGYFSKGRGSEKVEIDYTIKKNVKKPNGSKPGYVVYYTNYSLIVSPSITNIKLVSIEDQVFLERSYL